jgi:hypothetical protein
MGKASSAKRVARLAARGKGRKIRFQNGTTFPMAVAIVVILGCLLVGYARAASRSDASGPTVGAHWHLGYGIYICDHYLSPFQDNKEDTTEYQTLQIHSHGDGVMHWHPSNELAINETTGRKAKFNVFLELYGVDLSDSKMTLTGSELDPPGANEVYEEGVTKCNVNGKDEDASLRTIVWDRYDLPDARTVRTANLGDERIIEDQQVFVVAFVPDSVRSSDIPLPTWVTNLPELGAVDSGSLPTTSVPGTETTAGTATTVAGASTTAATETTVAGATTAPTVPGTTTPATTVAATSAAPSTTSG